MKKIIFIILLFSFIIFTGYATEESAFNNVVAFAQYIYDQLVAQNVDVRVSEEAYVYNIDKGKQLHIEGTFQPGNVYIFVVSGCDDASQIDMALFDANGNLAAPGESDGINSLLMFQVDKTADFVVVAQLTNTAAGKSSAHLGVIYMYVAEGK